MKKITGNISPVGKIGGNVTPVNTINGAITSIGKIDGIAIPLNTIRGNITYGNGAKGVSDYEQLNNLPSIEGVTLIGDKTLSDLGIDINDTVTDIQINGNSIVDDGIADIPIASSTTLGAVKVVSSYGIRISNGFLSIQKCSESMLRSPSSSTTSELRPVTADMSDMATFFSLARIAGDTTQGASENAIGTYTDDAKTAIRTMLGIDTASILQEIENGLPSAEEVSF